MKYGVIIYPKSKNYGDDIQTIAAGKLLPSIDYYLDRENLNLVNVNEKLKVILNGWFMENPLNWPPVKNINPLFISFHITHQNKSDRVLINKTHYNYFKKYEPIGCRDYHTLNLFNKIGIKAYFSGCITLTLKNQFKEIDRNEEILLIDPLNSKIPNKLQKKIINNIIPDSIKNKIQYISHFHNDIKDNFSRLQYVENLIEKYSKAHLIVTSRIHAALPALALNTPVLFLDLGFNSYNDRNRFGGLLQHFYTLSNEFFPFLGEDLTSKIYRKLHLYNLFYDSKKINFDWDTPPKPPKEIKIISEKIENKVKAFTLS